ncbi:unnamed protein product [Linum tenue]|uniref:Uncharacterized protein n=1 Tax=Linum tenue TaxID=586396 RepID=A0AAV0RIA0_9ROSI|nr:unnamed protein product [Linum tenue]
MKVFQIDGNNTLSLALFAEVANSKELLDSMQAGNLELEVSFMNASLIPDVFPILAAAHKAFVSKSRDSLTTRTLHSELVYNISGSKHLHVCPRSSLQCLAGRYESGRNVDLEELESRANQAQILKHYKISAMELGISSLADAITCRIASRDAL